MARLKRGYEILASAWLSLSRGVLSVLRSARSFARTLNISERLRRANRTVIRRVSLLPQHKRALAVVMIILISTLGVLLIYARRPRQTTYYIAYIGRYQRQGFDELHEKVLRKYLDELNQEMRGVRFELKTFNTKVDEDTNDSEKAYTEISKNAQYVLVIDNTWGRHLKPVAKLILGADIPVISLNADKQGVDYKHRVVFTGSDDNVPEKIIEFDKQILKHQQTILIAEEDFVSTRKFLDELPRSTPLLLVSNDKPNDKEKDILFDNLDRELANREPRQQRLTVVIHTHGRWGDEIIGHINTKEYKYKSIDILGGPFITNRKLDEVKLKDDNRLILFTHRRDAITKRVHQEIDSVNSENPELTKMLNVELFVKRCLNAVSIISSAVRPTQKPVISRQLFIEFFRGSLVNRNIVSDGELYSFDANLLLADERTFEQHLRGDVSSYPRQLNLRKDPIPNIYVGMDDICISAIDTKNRSFHADFFYWLKYDDPSIDAKKYVLFRNLKKGDEEELAGESESLSGVNRLFKMSGDFEMNVNLERYPLDRQEARIELAAIYPDDKLRVSFDHESFRRTESVERTKDERCQVYGVDDWIMGQRYTTVDNVISTSLGGGSSSTDKKLEKFELLNVRTPITRLRAGPFVTIILPLWMMGLAAVGLLFVKDSSFSSIGGVCVVIFLTIVTYSIGLAPIIQRSNALTVADKLFFGTFLTVFLVFLRVIVLASGSAPKRFHVWMNNKTTLIGTGALTIYCVLMFLALFGWDVLLQNATKEW